MSGVLAEIRGLAVSYDASDAGGTAALVDVDLEIVAGERLAVIGESGSGKSTLALALSGLLPAGAALTGRITWPGFASQPRPGRDIGYVFQNPDASLDPVMSIGKQIAEVVRFNLGVTWRDAETHAINLLGRVRLPDPSAIYRAYPHQLSGGQRQRAAVAAAIAARPRLLIADEATSALDSVVQAELVRLLDELVSTDGMTLLFITHDIALASSFADRIAVFQGGRLVEVGPTRRVIGMPAEAYTIRLLVSHIDLATPPLISRSGQ